MLEGLAAGHPTDADTPTRRTRPSLLPAGIQSGEIKNYRMNGVPPEMLARCVIALKWIPANILAELGTRAAQVHVRDTMLRGVVNCPA